jgi:DegV family protein with EDD domain
MSTEQITYLDGNRLYLGLSAGISQVLSNQQYLNKINVFPVPDGDTGTNLGFTLTCILNNTDQLVHEHAGQTAVAIADAALDGARGCSGVILAQFLQGFSDSCADLQQLNVHQFTHATETGYEYARQSVAEPVEGTILSVIRATVESCKDRTKEGVNDFVHLLKDTLLRAEEALRITPEQLSVLKKNGVVDAGGQGFVYILRGILDFITRGSLRGSWKSEQHPTTIQPPDTSNLQAATLGDQRYCTECLVVGHDIARNELSEALQGLGDSLILGGSKERVRIHIHTNEPQKVFDIARSFGLVEGEKADDMQQQARSAQGARKGVAVVTDSTADIPPEILEAYDIHIVPLKVHFGDKGYVDKVTLTPKELYQELATNPHHPKTSQPTPGDFWRTYQFLAGHYESIISLHLPVGLSGTIQSAEVAAHRLPEANITVINTNNATVGLGLIATAVSKAAREGKSHDALVTFTREVIDQTVFYAVIRDLASVVRGGRVPPIYKTIADVLRAILVLKMTPKGTISIGGVFFGKRDVPKGLVKWVTRRTDLSKAYEVFISHSNCLEGAQRIKELLPVFGLQTSTVHITDSGTIIGAHTGPGSLLIGLQSRT